MSKANQNNTTLAKSLTRREAGSLAIIGAFAAVTGSAVNATAAPDPIIAAIEAHRGAFRRCSETCRAVMSLEQPGPDESPAYIEAHEVDAAAFEVAENAAVALTDIRPTTLGPVFS